MLAHDETVQQGPFHSQQASGQPSSNNCSHCFLVTPSLCFLESFVDLKDHAPWSQGDGLLGSELAEVQILSPKVKLVMAVHIYSPRDGRAGRRSTRDLVGHPTWVVQ